MILLKIIIASEELPYNISFGMAENVGASKQLAAHRCKKRKLVRRL
jgi:hypothetical protein